MDKHVAQKGEVCIKREPLYIRPLRIRIPCGDETEEIEDRSQYILGDGEFKRENDPV